MPKSDGEARHRAARRIATMEEFSAASGISRPTLSRFFNDPSSVRPSSRARIEAAMERFGYRPNLFAVNFNRRNPKTLGILVPSLTDPFHAGIIQRIERQALAAGYWTVIQNCQGEPAREAEALATLMSLKVAGIIAVPLGHASRTPLYRDAARDTPLVLVDARIAADAAFVGTDNGRSIRLMVDYLLGSGSTPQYFDMPDVNENARERRRAFEEALRERGHDPVVHPVAEQGWDFERIAHGRAADLFRSRSMAGTTILCANDRIAFGVMAAASQAGLRVGHDADLRVAGHDDHPISAYACPSLTTVAQDGEDLASISLRVLLGQIAGEGGSPAEHRIEAKLMRRDSA